MIVSKRNHHTPDTAALEDVVEELRDSIKGMVIPAPNVTVHVPEQKPTHVTLEPAKPIARTFEIEVTAWQEVGGVPRIKKVIMKEIIP